ncbi:hypothetical protein ACTXT7_014963 [Hymenolepis weldensis]
MLSTEDSSTIICLSDILIQSPRLTPESPDCPSLVPVPPLFSVIQFQDELKRKLTQDYLPFSAAIHPLLRFRIEA